MRKLIKQSRRTLDFIRLKIFLVEQDKSLYCVEKEDGYFWVTECFFNDEGLRVTYTSSVRVEDILMVADDLIEVENRVNNVNQWLCCSEEYSSRDEFIEEVEAYLPECLNSERLKEFVQEPSYEVGIVNALRSERSTVHFCL